MKYDYYYEKTLEMTFNTNINLLLGYAKHYEDQNDSEHFYKILYAIVEKEKYLQIEYGYHSKLIELLSEKSKRILEKMFYDRMGNYQYSAECGYLNVVDPDYIEFLDKSDFKPATYYSVVNEKEIPDVKITAERRIIRKKYSLIDTKTKNEIPCPLELKNESLKIKQVFDFFIVSNSPNGLITIYNKEFKKLIDMVRHYDVDYKNEYIILEVYDDPRIGVYDKNFNLINYFNRDITKIGKYSVNDGVIGVDTNRRVVYFDYLNNREIDTFKIPNGVNLSRTTLAYSEGLYNFVDENGYHGYKDLQGNVVIEPKLQMSSPFLNGVACLSHVYGISTDHCFLDKNGELYDFNDRDKVSELENGLNLTDRLKYSTSIYDTTRWRFPLSFVQQAYQIKIWGDKVGCLVSNDWYLIDNNTPICEMDFKNSEKDGQQKKYNLK